MIFRNQGTSIKKTNSIPADELLNNYGLNSYEFTQKQKDEIFVCSRNKELDLVAKTIMRKKNFKTPNQKLEI